MILFMDPIWTLNDSPTNGHTRAHVHTLTPDIARHYKGTCIPSIIELCDSGNIISMHASEI